MDIKEEWLRDNLLIGNYNVAFPYLKFSVKNHSALTDKEKKSLIKALNKVQAVLLNKTCFRTFKESQ